MLLSSEQDSVFTSVSFSHQEASISLLSFSIRGQTDWKPQSQKLKNLITWTTALSNSMKPRVMPCRATQDGQAMVESSDKMWSPGEGNGKPFQYSCLENPMNSMKRRKDRRLKDELLRSVGAQHAAAAAKSLQLCPTPCDPIDGSPPGSPIPGILQARVLEWVSISVSSAWKWNVKVKSLSHVWLPVTPWMQPTRPLHPQDFPGKSTGVGCHCLLHPICYWRSVQFNHSVVSESLRPHEPQHASSPCPSPTPRAYSNSYPSSQWCHPTISSSDVPFSSHLQSSPASGSFPMSQLFTWGGQRIGVSASTSVLQMNTQFWSPLGWSGWISL